MLFDARTQIRDANDRYANPETAYLLQRMDGFDGLIVLTSNLRQNIDAAFLRRMDFVVEFALPDVEQRARLRRLHRGTGGARAACGPDPADPGGRRSLATRIEIMVPVPEPFTGGNDLQTTRSWVAFRRAVRIPGYETEPAG